MLSQPCLSCSVMSCKSDYLRFSLLQQVTPQETPVPCHLLFSSLVTKGRSSSLFRIQILLPGKNVSHLQIKLFTHSHFKFNTIFCASKWSWEITLSQVADCPSWTSIGESLFYFPLIPHSAKDILWGQSLNMGLISPRTYFPLKKCTRRLQCSLTRVLSKSPPLLGEPQHPRSQGAEDQVT